MDVVIGNNLPLLAGAGILPSLIAFLMSFTLKETPKFLLSCKKPQPALDAFYYYQGLTGTEAEMAASETMKEMSNEVCDHPDKPELGPDKTEVDPDKV